MYVSQAPTKLHAMALLAEQIEWIPWEPVALRSEFNSEYSAYSEEDSWVFTCPMLDENGRCSIYENRPSACRSYQPGQEFDFFGKAAFSICAMTVPGIGVCNSLKN